jgi:predicted nucleotidyltransferase
VKRLPLDPAGLKDVARAFPDAQLVVLFGSLARGQEAAWSDADVGVSGVGFWRGLQIGAAIAAALHREAHVVELEHASEWLRYQVAREGILLHEGQPDAWARFRAAAAIRYFDVQPIIARCAEGARRLLLDQRRG